MASVIRVSITGTLPGGEVWSVNPCFFPLDEPADITQPEVLAIATAVSALTVPTGVRQMFNSATAITGTRVEARSRTGVLEAQAEAPRASGGGGSGTATHPFQTSFVTSLRTQYPGAQGRGRLYWPATGILLDSTTLRVTSTVVASTLTGVKTFLTDIQSAVAVSAGPAPLTVWSRTGSAFHGVTSLRMGDVLDTQRRRRDALAEAYVEQAF